MAETEAEKAAREQAEATAAAAKLEAEKKAKEEADKAKPGKFEEWLAKQPAEVKAAYDEHTGGLKTALQAERDANKEGKKAAARLKELEDAEAKRQEAALSETDKLKKQVEAAEAKGKEALQKADERVIRSEVISVAAQLGFADPKDAFALVDRSTFKVKDDGAVEGVEVVLKDLAKAKPYMLKKAGSAGIGATNPSGAQGTRETDADRRKRLLG